MLIVKKGNPLILDESEESRRVYNALKEYVKSKPHLLLVELLPDKLFVQGRMTCKKEFCKSYKYPKSADLVWLYQKLDNVLGTVDTSDAYKQSAPQTRNFVKLAKDLAKRGGTLELIDDTAVLCYGTFEARMGNFGSYPELIQNELRAVINQTAELLRLKKLAKQHNLI